MIPPLLRAITSAIAFVIRMLRHLNVSFVSFLRKKERPKAPYCKYYDIFSSEGISLSQICNDQYDLKLTV